MFEAAAQPRGARRVLAAPDHFLFVAVQRAAALRARQRHRPRRGLGWPEAEDGRDDLGDDVAPFLENHRVAFAHVFARDVLGVVQRRHGDRGSGEDDRLQDRVRRDRAGPADVDLDLQQPGVRLLRRELEGGRPARTLRGRPEPLAQREIVHLDHDAVGVEVERPPLVGPFLTEGGHRVDPFAAPPVAFDRQPPGAHRAQGLAVRGDRGGACSALRCPNDLIHVGGQPSLRDERGIKIAHRPRRGVAWIGEERLAGVLALTVHAGKRRARQIDFAAHFEAAGRPAPQRERDGADGADVGRDLFAPRAVAARRAADQMAVVVGERDAQAVDFHLGHVCNRRVAQAGALAHALVEGAQLLVAVDVVEAEQRREVLDRLEAVDRPAGHALRRRIGGDEIGMLSFELLELVQQTVEGFVGDLGAVVDVVLLFVMADRITKLTDALFGRLLRGHRSAVARQNIVGQREQGVALRARRKHAERLLRALGEIGRAPGRVVD